MDLLKKAFTTPVKQEGTGVENQVSPDETIAPPERTEGKSQPKDDLPATDAAMAALREFTFNPSNPGTPSNAGQATMSPQWVMFSPPAPRALEPLETEEWPYDKDTSPNPISINRAYEILAASMSEVDCELPGAGIHGHAWMVEKASEWRARDDTGTVAIPIRPSVTDGNDHTPTYYRKKELHRVYMHMVLEGKHKLLEWFGKSMFVDLHVNKALPALTTPRQMLEHLEQTYAKPRHYRQHMTTVQKTFDEPYNPKRPVEVYYMKLQECKDDSRLLRRPYTNAQIMDKALEQFEAQFGNDAKKAEARWNRAIDKGDHEENWQDFKQFWKEEINEFSRFTRREAHGAIQIDDLTTRMNAMSAQMASLEAENRSYREANSAAQFRAAFAAQQAHDDEISALSALTGQLSDLRSQNSDLRSRLSNSTPTLSTAGTGSHEGSSAEEERRRQELLAKAKARPPDTYKDMNDGKGRQFKWYCWVCGCNCTHPTKGCFECPIALKEKYKAATTKQPLGGNPKFIERYGKFQREFGFDSL